MGALENQGAVRNRRQRGSLHLSPHRLHLHLLPPRNTRHTQHDELQLPGCRIRGNHERAVLCFPRSSDLQRPRR